MSPRLEVVTSEFQARSVTISMTLASVLLSLKCKSSIRQFLKSLLTFTGDKIRLMTF